MTPRSAAATVLIVGLLAWPSASAVVHAAQASTVSNGQPSAGSTLSTGPASAGGWQFADEDEQSPGWRQVLGAQGWDLGLFAAFTALALVSFFRKSVVLKQITFAAAVLYLGFAKSQLISVVNIFALVDWNLPIFKYSLAWYLLATFTVLSTVLWGRLYCGRMCAFGALTQLMDSVVPAGWRHDVPARLERRAAAIKYVVLGSAILYFIVTRDRSIYRYIEPFWMFSLHGSLVMWIGLGALLVATVFVRNLYCRFLCPVGAALGVLSNLTVFRIKRWKECNTCKTCEKACQWGAIQGPRIIKSECVRCDDCERLYMDEKKCPHWIIIRRRSDFKARPSAAPTG
jgi:NosR/NirI family nitrous oxide reductase transcriptional regulator